MTDLLRTSLAVKFSLRAVSRAALGCVLGATLLAAGAPARAADDGVPVDSKIFRSVLEGLGLRKDGEAIDYQERAPLVIPPSRVLPPPEKSDTALAKNPAWPKDPDVERRKQEAAQERNVSAFPDDAVLREARPLRPNEMTPGPKPRTTRRTDDGYRPSPNGSGSALPPSQLGTKGNFFSNIFSKDKPDTNSFTGEPPRTALTEPPPGYQTPSPEQPYGLGKSTTTTTYKPKNYLESHGTVDGGNTN